MKLPIHTIFSGLVLASLPVTAATLTSGHVDFIGIGYDGADFEPHSHVEENGVVDGMPVEDVEYELGDLIVEISATTTRDAGTAFDPIGVAAGVSFFKASENEIVGQPLVGFGLEELDPLEWSTNITVQLTGAVVPAGAFFSLWKGDVTPVFSMSTADGISSSDVVSLVAGAHVDYNWGFTQEGTYDLTFLISGTHAVNGPETATATYTFSIVPEPSAALLGALGALGLLRRRRN